MPGASRPPDGPHSRRRGAPPPLWESDRPDIHDLLTTAAFREMEMLPRGSNATFLARLDAGEGGTSLAVYKPRRGEAPLYDFPDGTLYRRERAAYVVSQALGWPAIPPTVIRDGPHGPGTVQLYVDHNPQAHYFTFGAEHAEQLRQLALFDVVANNADRKGGHCLESWSGAVWSIDHGLTFHRQPKLRTVIWDFRGDPLPPALSADLLAVCERLETGADPLRAELLELIAAGELAALLRRAEAVLEEGQYPDYGPYRNTPWPAI